MQQFKFFVNKKISSIAGSPILCGAPELPEVDFDFCTPNIRTSEIRRIFLTRVGSDPFNDWSQPFEWVVRMSETSNDRNAIRPLTVIGDKPAPSSTRVRLSMERSTTVYKEHTVNATIDEVNDINHAFVVDIRSGKYFKLHYETTGGYMFGGNEGIVAHVNIDMVLPRGAGEIMVYQVTITWKSLRTEDRVLSPIFNDPTGPCATVDGLVVTTTDYNAIGVAWDDNPLIGAYQYAITETNVEPTTGYTLTYGLIAHFGPLEPETDYYIWVRSLCNSGGISDWVSIQATTDALPFCETPTGVFIADIHTTFAAVLWDIMNALGTMVVVINATGIEPAVGTGTEIPEIDGILLLSPLNPGIHYYVYVGQKCDSGNYSEWVLVEFDTLATCPAVSSVNVISIHSTNAVGATDIAGNKEWVLNTTGITPAGAGTPFTGGTVTLLSLTPATLYYFYVRVDCGAGDFSIWKVHSFTTLP